MSDENFEGITPKRDKTTFPIPPLALPFGSEQDGLRQLETERKTKEKKTIRNIDSIMIQESLNQTTAKINAATRWGDEHCANILRKSSLWPKIDKLILLGHKLDQLDAAAEEPIRAKNAAKAARLQTSRNEPWNRVAYSYKLQDYAALRNMPREVIAQASEHFETRRGSVPPLSSEQTQNLISYLRSLLAEKQQPNPAKDESLSKKFGRWVRLP